MGIEPASVLLIEDNEVDVEAVRRAFEKHRLENPIFVANNGRSALEALRSNRVRHPYIVLLDLNLPRMSGLEFLETLRADLLLTDSVVFVLTTSKRDEDKAAAYRHHVAGYMVKSELGKELGKLVGMLDSYCQIVRLPAQKAPTL